MKDVVDVLERMADLLANSDKRGGILWALDLVNPCPILRTDAIRFLNLSTAADEWRSYPTHGRTMAIITKAIELAQEHSSER